MGLLGWVAVIAIGIGVVVVLRVIFLWTEEKTHEERTQAELERRGQAALDALRKLGRDYPRP